MSQGASLLIIDENYQDASDVKTWLAECGSFGAILHVDSSEKALAWIRDHQASPPTLILVDTRLRDMDGVDLVTALEDFSLPLRVVAMTDSAHLGADRARLSGMQSVVGHLAKPLKRHDVDDLAELVMA